MRKRLHQATKLIVADPRYIDLQKTPHGGGGIHRVLRPFTYETLINTLAHVVVTEMLQIDKA